MKHIDLQIEELEKELKTDKLNINLINQDLDNDVYLSKCRVIFQERWKIKQRISLLKTELTT